MDFILNVIILIVTSAIVGLIFYLLGHVHGFEKGESEILERTTLNFDDLVFEYCPDCKKARRADEILDAEVLQ